MERVALRQRRRARSRRNEWETPAGCIFCVFLLKEFGYLKIMGDFALHMQERRKEKQFAACSVFTNLPAVLSVKGDFRCLP
jgi:hypothetical protein